jgi:hypothetical protein
MQSDRNDPCMTGPAGIRCRRIRPGVFVRAGLFALLLAALPCLAQGEPTGSDVVAPTPAQTPVAKVLDSVEILTSWRDQWLQRFSAADPSRRRRRTPPDSRCLFAA